MESGCENPSFAPMGKVKLCVFPELEIIEQARFGNWEIGKLAHIPDFPIFRSARVSWLRAKWGGVSPS